jgi:hypothetical protein
MASLVGWVTLLALIAGSTALVAQAIGRALEHRDLQRRRRSR